MPERKNQILRIPDVAKDKSGVMDHIKALRNRPAIGQNVVVWGLVYGAELAISLAEEGKDVVLIGEADQNAIASHGSNSRKYWVLRKVTDVNVVRVTPEAARVNNPRVMTNIKVDSIAEKGVEIIQKDGSTETLPYDTLIISRGRQSNDVLYDQLEGRQKK